MNQGELTSNGLRVSYTAAGSGEPVVLLHGVAENRRWMLPLFDDLAKSFRVYNVDLPGHGESERNGEHVGFKDVIGWIDGLLDALQIDRVRFVGNSLGGRIAIEYALRNPDRVERLAAIVPPLAIHSNRQLIPLATIIPPRIGAYIPLERLGRTSIVRRRVRSALLNALYARPKEADEADVEEAVDGVLDWLHDGDRRTLFLAWLKRIYLEDPRRFWTRLATLKPEALFVFAQQDGVVAAGLADRVRRTLPNARTIVVPDAGHAVLREARDLVIAEVRRLMA